MNQRTAGRMIRLERDYERESDRRSNGGPRVVAAPARGWPGWRMSTRRWDWCWPPAWRCASSDGGPDDFRWAFGLMLAACLVDATDGTSGPTPARQGVAAELRRREARRPHRLSDVHVAAAGAGVAGRAAAGGRNGCWSWRWWPAPTVFARCRPRRPTATSSAFRRIGTSWPFILYVLQIPGWVAAAVVLVLVAADVRAQLLHVSQPRRHAQPHDEFSGRRVGRAAGRGAVDDVGDETAAETSTAASIARWHSLFYPLYYMAVSWAITIDRWQRISHATRARSRGYLAVKPGPDRPAARRAVHRRGRFRRLRPRLPAVFSSRTPRPRPTPGSIGPRHSVAGRRPRPEIRTTTHSTGQARRAGAAGHGGQARADARVARAGRERVDRVLDEVQHEAGVAGWTVASRAVDHAALVDVDQVPDRRHVEGVRRLLCCSVTS